MFKWFRQHLRNATGADDLNRRASMLEDAVAEVRAGQDKLGRDLLGRAQEDDHRWAEVLGRIETLELRASVPVVMAAAARASLERTPLVSVITPSLDRPGPLARAIQSIRAQTYENWELVLVAGSDGVALAERAGDPRIRTVTRDGPGVCAARNLGLAAASGDLIAYLDDDNLMDPGWLKTVAWGFDRWPEADVLYGAYVLEDVQGVSDSVGGGMPGLVLNRFARERLRDANPTDASAIAHRAGLAEARFDEDLVRLGDWELLARITAERDPIVVPAIASFYGTTRDDRLSLTPPSEDEFEAVRRACAGPPGQSSR